jgi:hypothetical protein
MQNVHLRADVLDVLTWQLSCGAFEGCTSDKFRTVIYDEGLAAIQA